jgi:CMP/dCMP kinase
MIITIDGPAGTGKTTVAKNLAQELGYTYFDTGSMYRAITYGIIQNKIDPDDENALQAFLKSHPVTIETHFNEKRIFLAGIDVTSKIRTQEVTDLVSKVASLRAVRDTLVATQRLLSKGVNAVFEGRDMGSVVFPDADIKIFLTASLEVRAKRRYNELIAKHPEDTTLTLNGILADIDRRDKYDASRDISPMKQADDSILIDTSNLSCDDVINCIINITKDLQDKPLTQA